LSHYAKVVDGIVTQVVVAEAEFFETFVDSSPGHWIQTSYNTRGGIHYDQDLNPDGGVALRGNYAGIGYNYDAVNDVFYPPQPFPSWTLDTGTWLWNPPTPMPADNNIYKWDESIVNWVEVTNTPT
jgi:hypothetical protein